MVDKCQTLDGGGVSGGSAAIAAALSAVREALSDLAADRGREVIKKKECALDRR
jgi:hypothetical protein